MRGVFGSKKNLWEELYDYETNTYFYRHRFTGEFSRANPEVKESDSSHVPKKNAEPLWETLFDPETHECYWTDIETGKVCFARPNNGTFVSEVPLKDFRKANRIASKQSRLASSRRSVKSSATKSMRVVKRDDDFGIVSGDSSDLNFEELFGSSNPAQYDAGALLNAGTSSARPQTDDVDIPAYPELDEDTVLANSTIVTDNPLFAYGK